MERLHAAAQDLGRVREVRDRLDLDPGLGEVSAGAVGGEALDSSFRQPAGKLDDAFTVLDGGKSAQRATSLWGNVAWVGWPQV